MSLRGGTRKGLGSDIRWKVGGGSRGRGCLDAVGSGLAGWGVVGDGVEGRGR